MIVVDHILKKHSPAEESCFVAGNKEVTQRSQNDTHLRAQADVIRHRRVL